MNKSLCFQEISSDVVTGTSRLTESNGTLIYSSQKNKRNQRHSIIMGSLRNVHNRTSFQLKIWVPFPLLSVLQTISFHAHLHDMKTPENWTQLWKSVRKGI